MSIAVTPLTKVSNLLVTLNSSVNFIIYIIYGEKFQRLFLFIFCKRTQGRDQILRRYTTSTTFQATSRQASTILPKSQQSIGNGYHRSQRRALFPVSLINFYLKHSLKSVVAFTICHTNAPYCLFVYMTYRLSDPSLKK